VHVFPAEQCFPTDSWSSQRSSVASFSFVVPGTEVFDAARAADLDPAPLNIISDGAEYAVVSRQTVEAPPAHSEDAEQPIPAMSVVDSDPKRVGVFKGLAADHDLNLRGATKAFSFHSTSHALPAAALLCSQFLNSFINDT